MTIITDSSVERADQPRAAVDAKSAAVHVFDGDDVRPGGQQRLQAEGEGGGVPQNGQSKQLFVNKLIN